MPQKSHVQITPSADAPTINRHLYGHFAEHLGRCVYEGLWVGEDSAIPHTRGIRKDVVAAIKRLDIPNLRWPGGCFADEYHWRDGIGPREDRPRTVNSLWGGVVETNEFGTHEFLDLCDQLSEGRPDDQRCEPYIAGNLGSGTVREMQEWIQYLTYDGDTTLTRLRAANGRKNPWPIKYFGVGNENWGCGGAMRPEFYANQYRQYAEFCRNYSGNELYRIACGPNGRDENWTRVLMDRVNGRMQGLSLHYYTVGDWHQKGSASRFDTQEYFDTLRRCLKMDDIITAHAALMDEKDPDGKVALIVDEWGTWFDVEPGTNPGFLYQQNTVRDALVAGITLNIFHQHAARVRMANLAQLVNVLQAPILTDGPDMLLTPTYHVLEMYKVHQEAQLLATDLTGPHYTQGKADLDQLHASASRAGDGTVHVSLCNLHHDTRLSVTCSLAGLAIRSAEGSCLSGDSIDDMNTFQDPERVVPGQIAVRTSGSELSVDLPAHGVAVIRVQTA